MPFSEILAVYLVLSKKSYIESVNCNRWLKICSIEGEIIKNENCLFPFNFNEISVILIDKFYVKIR
jgi:hypothetical protein